MKGRWEESEKDDEDGKTHTHTHINEKNIFCCRHLNTIHFKGLATSLGKHPLPSH